MFRFKLAAWLLAACLLQAPQCECQINIEFLFQDVLSLGETTSSRKPLMSDIFVFSPGRNANISAYQQKGIFNAFNIGVPFEVITGELKPTGKETMSTEFVEQPESGFQISHANDQPLKLSDISGLKSVLGNLHNKMLSSGVAREDGSDRVDNTDEVNPATGNDQPNFLEGISIIVVNELNTTPQTPPPAGTVDTDVIATNANFENYHRKKNCNLFNIQGVLSKLLNLSPYQAQTTHRPTTTQQPRVEESSILPFLNFDNEFLAALDAAAAPIVTESADVHKKKHIFADCGKNNGDSQRSCGLSLLKIPGLLSKILTVALLNTPQKTTAAPKMNALHSQRFPLQDFPIQVSKTLSTFSFQEYPPTMTKIFPLVDKHRNDNASNGQAGGSIIERTLNALSNASPEDQESHNKQQKEGHKPNTLYFDNTKSVQEDFNPIK